jgi:translation initiation factor 2B subunit (eIF-2B alpha/beta/delta family)
MMMTETTRAKKLVKLLERLIKQDHLYTDDKVREMKEQLRAVKEEIAQLEAQTSKGFGKK